MRVIIAGGVFRLSAADRQRLQPAPEQMLADGLVRQGLSVRTMPLENISSLVWTRDVDVIHVHHLSKASVAAVTRPLRRPVIFTPHSGALPVKRRERAGYRVVTQLMAAGVCLSGREKELRSLGGLAGRAEKWHVIPNGIDLPAAPAVLRTLDGPNITLLFVGQLIDTKRVHLIIEALTHLPDARLRLVYQNAHLERHLRSLAVEYEVEDRVAFLGRRSGLDLFDEYFRADALILPSVREALPSVVSEALSTGLPVVATDVGGVTDQVGLAGVIVRNDGAVAGLTAGIESLLDEYPVFASRAFARATYIRSSASVESMARKHIELYSGVIA